MGVCGLLYSIHMFLYVLVCMFYKGGCFYENEKCWED